MSATRLLQDRALLQVMMILDKAAQLGAAGVDLAPVADGLEVSYRTGTSAVGTLLKDRDLEREMFALLVKRAGLETKTAGLMPWQVLGQIRRVAVIEYDVFGEAGLRLRFQSQTPFAAEPPRQRS